MEGIGAEVSQKIRSAIKAKLMELGAYVDEELPDYIMVMVANKRSKQQMESDLDLFLGDSAATFTTWLHQVLIKLQEVTVSSIDSKSTSAENVDKKRKPVLLEEHRKEKEKEKKKKAKKEKEKEDEKIRHKPNIKDVDLKKEDCHVEPIVDKDINDVQKNDASSSPVPINPVPSSSEERTMPVTKPMCPIDEDDDDFINLKADVETDLWEGETEEMSISIDGKKSDNSNNVFRKLPETTQQDLLHKSTKPTKQAETPKQPSEYDCSVSPPPVQKSVPPVVPPGPVRPQSTSRIIKISEVLREEKETLNPSLKRNLDEKRQGKRPDSSETSDKKSKSSIVPTTSSAEEKSKEDDEDIFGKHIANELRLLTPRQRSLAKLKIQQVLYECQETPSVKSKICDESRNQEASSSRRRRKDPPRRPMRLERQRSPVRPPERQRSSIRRPVDRKRSPFRLGSMRMDSPAYNRPKPKLSSS